MEMSKIVRWSAIVIVSVFLTTVCVNGDPECEKLLQVQCRPPFVQHAYINSVQLIKCVFFMFRREMIIWHNLHFAMFLIVFGKYSVLFTIRIPFKIDWKNKHMPFDLLNCKFSFNIFVVVVVKPMYKLVSFLE